MSSEVERSDMKSSILMELMRRKEYVIGGLGVGACTLRVVSSAKWSDGVDGKIVMAGDRSGSEGVMSRSRVLPLV